MASDLNLIALQTLHLNDAFHQCATSKGRVRLAANVQHDSGVVLLTVWDQVNPLLPGSVPNAGRKALG
jgi:hypothetical protein